MLWHQEIVGLLKLRSELPIEHIVELDIAAFLGFSLRCRNGPGLAGVVGEAAVHQGDVWNGVRLIGPKHQRRTACVILCRHRCFIGTEQRLRCR